MRFSTAIRRVGAAVAAGVRQPAASARHCLRMADALRADAFVRQWPAPAAPADAPDAPAGPLAGYAANYREGPGIWKWTHYFEIYERHLTRFAGTDAHLVEIGIYSGGSLAMWRWFLGPRGRISGIDIEPRCKAYEDPQTRVFIGDQASRRFWRSFRAQAPPFDVVIDDGGHTAEQQIVTLEETLPYLRPGGVYLCEDVHGVGNRFAAYAHRLCDHLNAAALRGDRSGLTADAAAIQGSITAVHLYPFVVVIEKASRPVGRFTAPRHGTDWQPFL